MAARRPRITALDKTIAERVRALRGERNMSQPTVAGALGITYQSYQKIEGGKVAFRATTLKNLAALFGVPAWALITGDDMPPLPNAEATSHVVAAMSGMDEERAREVLDFAIRTKQAA